LVVIPSESCTFYNLSENGSTYFWTFGDGGFSYEEQPVYTYVNEGVYTVSLYVESIHGCKDTLIIPDAVVAESSCEMIFPNAFAPAGANLSENRVFKPIYRGVEDYELNIFNQWGELIFVSNDPNVGWDGMYRGDLCKLDVYVWKATWVCINGEKFSRAGDVTLLR
jgi:gliding motility-associated-like protein